MQVTCPQCGARYAVDPAAIGPTGRTVQCVRCSHRWFETVKAAPAQVRAWFTQNLEPAFSTLEVANERGERVDQGVTQPDPGSPAALRIALKPIGTGTYRVKWRVLSVDTHVTEGDFTFKVQP